MVMEINIAKLAIVAGEESAKKINSIFDSLEEIAHTDKAFLAKITGMTPEAALDVIMWAQAKVSAQKTLSPQVPSTFRLPINDEIKILDTTVFKYAQWVHQAPFSLRGPGSQFTDLLCMVYNSSSRIKELANRSGLDLSRIAFEDEPRFIIHSVLCQAANSERLTHLISCVLQDSSAVPIHNGVKELVLA